MMLTQEDFAKVLEVSTKTIRNWENGKSHPRNRMGAIEQYLEAPKDDAVTAGDLAAIEQRVRASGLFSGAQLLEAIELAKKSYRVDRQAAKARDVS